LYAPRASDFPSNSNLHILFINLYEKTRSILEECGLSPSTKLTKEILNNFRYFFLETFPNSWFFISAKTIRNNRILSSSIINKTILLLYCRLINLDKSIITVSANSILYESKNKLLLLSRNSWKVVRSKIAKQFSISVECNKSRYRSNFSTRPP
jgi:hypothetical protein